MHKKRPTLSQVSVLKGKSKTRPTSAAADPKRARAGSGSAAHRQLPGAKLPSSVRTRKFFSLQARRRAGGNPPVGCSGTRSRSNNNAPSLA